MRLLPERTDLAPQGVVSGQVGVGEVKGGAQDLPAVLLAELVHRLLKLEAFGFFEGIVKKRDLKGGGGGELFAAHPKTAVFFPRLSHHTEDSQGCGIKGRGEAGGIV